MKGEIRIGSSRLQAFGHHLFPKTPHILATGNIPEY
jgi:hypothetical protein